MIVFVAVVPTSVSRAQPTGHLLGSLKSIFVLRGVFLHI